MSVSGFEGTPPPEPAFAGGEETPSSQQDTPASGERNASPQQGLLPSASSALVTMPVPKLLKARKLPIRKSTCKAADLGLGAAGPGVSEPASDPMPTAAASPPVVPSVDAGAAVDEAAAKDVPAFEEQEISKESDILLQLEGPEIPAQRLNSLR